MKRAVIGLALVVLVAGCGKSAEEKQQEEAAKQAQAAAQATEQAAQQAAKGIEALAKGLSGAGGDMKPVEPVSFREFIALFPELEGWEKEKPTGEKMSMPVSYST